MTDSATLHLDRARAHLRDARRAASCTDKARYLAAAVESAAAIVESMRFQAKNEQQLLDLARAILPRYLLLKRVRIHNFHRKPVPIPSQNEGHATHMLGPISLSAGTEPNSYAIVTMMPGDSSGPKYETGGSGKINLKPVGSEKELWIDDGKLWDESKGEWVDLDLAVNEYLAKVPEFLDQAAPMCNGA
jgi:hypothetical protein